MCDLSGEGLLSTKCCITAVGVECSSQLSSICQSSWHSIPLAQCSFHHGTYHGPLRPSPKLSWARRRLGRFNLWPPMVPTVLHLSSYCKVLAFPTVHAGQWLTSDLGFRLGGDEGPAAAHPPAGGGARDQGGGVIK